MFKIPFQFLCGSFPVSRQNKWNYGIFLCCSNCNRNTFFWFRFLKLTEKTMDPVAIRWNCGSVNSLIFNVTSVLCFITVWENTGSRDLKINYSVTLIFRFSVFSVPLFYNTAILKNHGLLRFFGSGKISMFRFLSKKVI